MERVCDEEKFRRDDVKDLMYEAKKKAFGTLHQALRLRPRGRSLASVKLQGQRSLNAGKDFEPRRGRKEANGEERCGKQRIEAYTKCSRARRVATGDTRHSDHPL